MVKNAWSYTSLPQYTSVAWCSVTWLVQLSSSFVGKSWVSVTIKCLLIGLNFCISQNSLLKNC